MMAQRLALPAALLLLSGCVLLSGASSLEIVDEAQPVVPSGQDDGGGNDRTGDGSVNPTVAPEKDADASGELLPPTRPNPGTYTYAVTGGDQLKGAFPFKATYGPTATVKIEHDGATCFNQTITLRDGYTEAMHECVIGTELVQNAGVRAQKFPLVGTATTNLDCKPGDAYFSATRTVNRIWQHTCDGSNSDDKSGDSKFVTAGEYRFVGQESVTVNNVALPVLHYHDERAVSGKQTGANVADWFFSIDGILVRLVRNIDITYASIVGNVNYVETVTMTLSELPQQ